MPPDRIVSSLRKTDFQPQLTPSQKLEEGLSPPLTRDKDKKSIDFEKKRPAPIFHFSRSFHSIGNRHIYLLCYGKNYFIFNLSQKYTGSVMHIQDSYTT